MKFTRLFSVAVVLGLASMAVLSAVRAQTMKELTGSVSYRERIALPPAASVNVKLLDVSLADAPATIIAETTVTPGGQVPVPFTLSYDPARIDPAHRYVLQAQIVVDGKLMFITDQNWPVFDGEPDKTDLLVVRVADAAN